MSVDPLFQAGLECDSINVVMEDITTDEDAYTVIHYDCRDCGESWDDEFEL